jgi:hypothetical protein
VRGVGYVKLDDNAAWPTWLDDNLIRAPEGRNGQGNLSSPDSSPTAAR